MWWTLFNFNSSDLASFQRVCRIITVTFFFKMIYNTSISIMLLLNA